MRHLICTIVLILSGVTAVADMSPAEHAESVEEWYRGRISRLTSDTGYLTLVALCPLPEGRHRIGSADDNDCVLPPSVAAHAAVIEVASGKATLIPGKGSGLLVGDTPAARMTLVPDVEENTTLVESGTVSFYVIERAGDLYLRVKDTESEARRNFKGTERYPVDDAWRVQARFEPYDPPKPIEIPDILGFTTRVQCPGALVFTLQGKECRLEPTSTGKRWFLVFGDETSGVETYGGGRFVYVDAPDEDGITWIDFNEAYNPPCVFTPYATCPLPHADNILPLEVTAGEKGYSDMAH